MISSLLRRALTAALIGAAGAAGTMVAKRMLENKRGGKRGTYNERLALNRWENEGGQPAQPKSNQERGAAPL